jgi:hypothetical protein
MPFFNTKLFMSWWTLEGMKKGAFLECMMESELRGKRPYVNGACEPATKFVPWAL